MHICDVLTEIHFLPATPETEHDLIHIEPKSEFIAADKDKVRKGKHQRSAFVLIIYIIFRVDYRKEGRMM